MVSRQRKVGQKVVRLAFEAKNGSGATCFLFVELLRRDKSGAIEMRHSIERRSLARCLDAIHKGPVGRELTTSDSAWLEKELGL